MYTLLWQVAYVVEILPRERLNKTHPPSAIISMVRCWWPGDAVSSSSWYYIANSFQPGACRWRHNGQTVVTSRLHVEHVVWGGHRPDCPVAHSQFLCIDWHWMGVTFPRSTGAGKHTLIPRFMGPTWGPSGADRTRVGPMLATWTLLSGYWNRDKWLSFCRRHFRTHLYNEEV